MELLKALIVAAISFAYLVFGQETDFLEGFQFGAQNATGNETTPGNCTGPKDACAFETYRDVWTEGTVIRFTGVYVPSLCKCDDNTHHCLRAYDLFRISAYVHLCRPLSESGIGCPGVLCPYKEHAGEEDDDDDY